jgi:hypothetical protein
VVSSDRPYGFIHQAAQVDAGAIDDYGSDLAVGRITGDAAGAANAVAKIIGYEDHPPTSAAFYSSATSAAFFQHCVDPSCVEGNATHRPEYVNKTQEQQPFLLPAQQASGTLEFAGKTVARRWSDTEGDTPQKFGDGSAIPADIAAGITSGFGVSLAIRSDINAGRFLVIHNDHGYTDGSGWANPEYTTASLNNLSNDGVYPVLWSLNCNTGDFDRHTATNPDFTQFALSLSHKGSVGELASSRLSGIGWDGRLGRILANTAFPEQVDDINQKATNAALPGSGLVLPKTPAIARLGDTTNVALAALVAGVDMATNVGGQGTDLEYNTFGDPTMYMWRAAPKLFDTSGVTATLVDGRHMQITLPGQPDAYGANVTLVKDGHYVGRGVLAGDKATIQSAQDLTAANGLKAIFERQDYVSTTAALGDFGPPHVTSIAPASGPATGGTAVAITGDGFTGVNAVLFGGHAVPATVDAGVVHATAPAGVGTADVIVRGVHGNSPTTPADRWTWLPAVSSIDPPYAFAGNTVTIHGAGLVGVTGVMFGDVSAASFTSVDANTVTAVVPSGTGTVRVTVLTATGPSVTAVDGDNAFTYFLIIDHQ